MGSGSGRDFWSVFYDPINIGYGDKAFGGPKGVETPDFSGQAQSDLDAAKDSASKQALAAKKQKQRSIARSKSIFTSPLGVTEEASVARKTLLGE